MPKVSVIVPVYNVEQYLERCLDSIVNQTLEDIEIIIVNDGSTDGSLKICEKYQAEDKRIILLNQNNKGVGHARNKALDIVRGEYICFVDSDDWIDITMLEEIYNFFKKTQADVIQFNYTTYYENGKFQGYQNIGKWLKKYLNKNIRNYETFNFQDVVIKSFKYLPKQIWDRAYSTEFIKNNNIHFAPTKISEDNAFSLAAYLLAKKILYIDTSFYNYFMRTGSTVNKASNDNFDIFEAIKFLENYMRKIGIYEKYSHAFKNYVNQLLAWHYNQFPEESVDEYEQKCKDFLEANEYRKFKKMTKPELSFLEKLFSIKNKKVNGLKQKFLCLCGIKIDISKFKRNTLNESKNKCEHYNTSL